MGADLTPAFPPTGARDPRWRRLGAGAGILLAGRIVTAACGLIQVPIAFAHLGTEAFGLWVALAGLLWSLAILDCGLGFAVQNRLTTLLAEAREAEAAALVQWALRALAVGGALVLVAGMALARWGRWGEWLGATNPALQAQARGAIAIVFIAAAVNLPLTLAARVAAAAQQLWLTGVWTAAGSILGLAAVAVAARQRWPLAGFLAAACVLPLVAGLGTGWSVRRRFGWLQTRTAAAPDRRGLWRESGLFFMPQLGAMLLGAFVPTLVALCAGPAAAGTFGVLQRLFGFALQLQSLALMSTWPAYADAAARGDAAFVRRSFRATWWLTLGGFILPTVVLTPWVPAVIHLWLGVNAPVIAPALLWAMAGWHVLQFCGQPIAMVLNGFGRIKSLAILGWLGIGVALGLCALLGPKWGALGVIAALATPYALLNLPVTAWVARQALAELGARGATAGRPHHE